MMGRGDYCGARQPRQMSFSPWVGLGELGLEVEWIGDDEYLQSIERCFDETEVFLMHIH